MRINKIKKYFVLIVMISVLGSNSVMANGPHRVGTTTANFLEIGYGSAGIAMGDAYVSMVEDVSAVYWNPAGLAFMPNSEAQFMVQPWLVDVNTSFLAVGIPVNGLGTVAFSLTYMDFGDMEVTNLEMQEGTGEMFSASDFALSVSYGRAIATWFAFGASAKYISSQIWHTRGSAFAFDLGVMIKTRFFSPSGKQQDGMRLGMSISNYGTRLKYDGTDLLNPIDILPDENGNYHDVPGQFRLNEWELPQIFRVGFSVNPLIMGNQTVTVAVNALHPNNNSESINLGMQYKINIPAFGELYLRGGYKALFMEASEYGVTLGAGFRKKLIRNTGIRMDYAYRDIGILGSVNCFELGFQF